MALKIPTLLVKYLYKYKTLSLSGLGVFTLDKSVVIPEEPSRDAPATANGIEFKSTPVRQPDPALIDFICQETGKIKPLALADLDSYLTLGSEMLNIGKPFYIEGIGTLTRRKDGRCDFIPGEFALIRENADGSRRNPEKQTRRKPTETAEAEQDHARGRGLLIAVAAIAALLIIGWGGYTLYRKNMPKSEPVVAEIPVTDTVRKMPDTLTTVAVKDSLKIKAADTPSKKNNSTDSLPYKFVILATHDKEHALKRYNQLLGFALKVHMTTADSLYFKLFFTIPSSARDTTHIKDSIEREYAHHVTIEQ